VSALARFFARARVREEQDGWLIVEIMIGAVALIITALAIYSGLDGASRTSGRNRNRSVASYLAQQDQERMRAMDATALSNYSSTRVVTVAKVPYTVNSTASFVSDTSGSVSCTNSSTTARYLKITSSVADPSNRNAPVVEDSLLSPKPSDSGAAVQIIDHNGTGVSGIPINLDQPPSWSSTTDSSGCVLFGFLDTGTSYTVSFSRSGWVNPLGVNAITGAPITQVPGTTTLTQFSYDQAGSVTANFQTTPSGGATQASKATQLTAFNTNLPTTPSLRNYGPFTSASSYQATGLYPFTGAYVFYSGNCLAEKPPSSSTKLAAASAAVTPGSSQTVTVTEPAINVTVKNGSGVVVNGATVYLTESDSGCTDSYTDTSNASGLLANQGYPFGHYYVCATTGSGSSQRWGWNGAVDNTGDNGTSPFTITVSSSSKNTTYCP
jgi:Tfp pilus assembly protein PilV